MPASGSIYSDDRKGALMISPKVEVASMLKALPEDASLEDIQYHHYVLEK